MALELGVGLAAAAAPIGIPLPRGGSISAVAGPHSVVLLVHGRPKLAQRLQLVLDDTVAKASVPALSVIAEPTSGVLILQDSYYSRSRGLSYCQAGNEQFLRVLDLNEPAKETLHLKLASCLANLELDEAGVIWDFSTKSLEIHWLNHPYAKYEIGPQGQAKLVTEK